MQNARLDESQVGIKTAGRNNTSLRSAHDTTLMTKSEEELKSLLMKVKEESEKAGLILNIHKSKVTASGPITSWQIDGEKMETVTDFIFMGSKITADSDCSHEIKRRLLLGRKALINLDRLLKSRDITLPKKVHLVKSMVSQIVMYRCERWTIKKAERQKNWCFWTVGPEKTLESLLDCKEIKQSMKSTLNIHWKSWCWSWSSNPLATWCEELTHWKRPWCWEQLRAGGEGDDGRWDGIIDSIDMSLSKFWRSWRAGKPGVLQSMGSQRIRHNLVTEQQIPEEAFSIPDVVFWYERDFSLYLSCNSMNLRRALLATWYH